MVKLLLGLDVVPAPHDAADALAVAICHGHSAHGAIAAALAVSPARPLGGMTSWRDYRP